MGLPVTSAAVPPPRSVELWAVRDLVVPLLGVSFAVVVLTFPTFGRVPEHAGDIWLLRALAVTPFILFAWYLRRLGPRRVVFTGDLAHVQWLWRAETLHRDDVTVHADRQVADDVEPYFQLVWVTGGRRIRFGLTLDDPRGDLLTSFGDASAIAALQTSAGAPATSSPDNAGG